MTVSATRLAIVSVSLIAMAACGGRDVLKQTQAARRSALAESQPLTQFKRSVNRRPVLAAGAGGHSGATLARLFGRPAKPLAPRGALQSRPLRGDYSFTVREIPPVAEVRRAPAPRIVIPSPETAAADPVGGFSVTRSRPGAHANARPPQILAPQRHKRRP